MTSCEQPKLQQDLSRLFPYHERARCFCWTAAVFSAPRLPVLNIGGRHVVLFQAPSLQRGWAGTCRPRGEAKQVLDLSQCSMLPRSANVSRSAVSCSGASPQPEIVPFAGGRNLVGLRRITCPSAAGAKRRRSGVPTLIILTESTCRRWHGRLSWEALPQMEEVEL